MRVMAKISKRIEEEIADTAEYAEMALLEKDQRPWLAEILYTISLEERSHMNRLHQAVVRLIEEYRKEHGEPPADMLSRYEYEHKRHIEAARDARVYQDMYND